MPEYTLAAIVWLGGAALAAALVGGRRWGLLGERRTWLTLAVFGAFTIVFDVILTGLPIVTYGDEFRSGLAIGPMPLEDLLYGLALALTALAAFTAALGRRRT